MAGPVYIVGGVGGSVWVSSDAPGGTWSSALSSGPNTFLGVSGNSLVEIYASGNDELYRFNGSTWTKELTSSQLWGVHSNGVETFAIATSPNSKIYRREANGTWTPTSNPFSPYSPGRHIHVSDDKEAWAALTVGRIGRWDGDADTWSTVNLGGNNAESTSGIWSVSPSEVYAAVSRILFGSPTIYVFDGVAWSVFASRPGFFRIYNLHAPASDNIWVVGENGGPRVEHYDGVGWTAWDFNDLGVASNTAINAIWSNAKDDVWVGGTQDSVNSQALFAHWDGASWTVEANNYQQQVDGIWVGPPPAAISGDGIVNRRGGDTITLTGTFALNTAYRAYVGTTGTASDAPAFSGVPGQGFDLYSADGVTLQFVTPPMALGTNIALLVGPLSEQAILTAVEYPYAWKDYEARKSLAPWYDTGARRPDSEEPQ